jgi:predicted MPP superfamily phosphohydrolase
MKIQLLSDIHLECFNVNSNHPQISNTNADIIVLSGDIGEGFTGVEYANEQSNKLNKDIVYVPGNHEYYGQNMAQFRKNLYSYTKGSQIHLLDNKSIVINGIRFIGATLWTNFGDGNKELMKSAFMRINDYRTIRATHWWDKRNRNKFGAQHIRYSDMLIDYFLPEIAIDEHIQSIKFISQ